MPFRAVCRLCLATDLRNYILLNTPLQDVYEKLTTQPLNTPNKPVVACYLCAAQLRKCLSLMDRAMKANNVLNILLKKDLTKMKYGPTLVVDLDACNLTEALTRSPMNNVDILGDDPNIKIKQEPHDAENEANEFGNRSDDDDPSSGQYMEVEIKNEPQEFTIEIEEIPQSTPADASTSAFQPNVFIRDVTAPTQYNNNQEFSNHKSSSETEDIPSVSVFRSHTEKKPLKNGKEVIQPIDMPICLICKEGFRNKESFRIHLRSHSGKKPYRCATCNKKFVDRNKLIDHLRLHNYVKKVDTSKKYSKCATCGKKFTDRKLLNDHLREHNGSIVSALKPFLKVRNAKKIFTCGSCNKKFNSRNLLIEHLRVHSVKKPFGCNKCNYKFVSDDRLKIHMKVHEPKAFVCTVCGERFDGERYLFKHFSQHSDRDTIVFVHR